MDDALDPVQRLEAYCDEHRIDYELIQVDGTAHSAGDAVDQLDIDPAQVVKSLVFLADGEPVLAQVCGPDNVDEQALIDALPADDVRLAEPDEVEEIAGYAVGAVPPVGTGLPAVVDERVLSQETVYGGGGADDHVIALDPRFIVAEHDIVADITV